MEIPREGLTHRLLPFAINVALAGAFRLLLPTTIAEGGERYLYYMMSLFFPYRGCAQFQCFRFLPPLVPSLLPFEVIDSFVITGVLCQVVTGTLLWHLARRFHPSRCVAFLTTCWYWAVWGPIPMLRDPLLIADPMQTLWLVAAILLLVDGRYWLALPILITGAGVKESVLTVPVVYSAYLILAGDTIRRRIPWLAILTVLPIVTWMIARRVLMSAFGYAPPGDSQYLANPYLFGLWLHSLGPWPLNLAIAGLYIFSGFGAAWIFGGLGLLRADRRIRALTAASAPAMAFLALYQEPHRAVACFPWAVLIPAAVWIETLPLPLVAAVLAVNAAFTIRMSATVSWLPNASILLALLIVLACICVFLKARQRRPAAAVAASAPAVRSGGYTVLAPVGLALLLMLVVGYHLGMADAFRRTTLELPAAGEFARDDAGTPGLALSPDGGRVVYTGARRDGTPRTLWLRQTDASTDVALAGTEGATAPFWSPDSRRVGFFASDRLKWIDVVSGEVRDVTAAKEPYGGAWAPDGTLLFGAGMFAPLRRVSATGGGVTPATVLDARRTRSSHRSPHMLPDGRRFLFTDAGAADEAIRVGSLESTESRQVLEDAYDAVYVRPGLIFFGRQRSVRVQPFDLRRLMALPDDMATSLPAIASPHFSRAAFSVSARTIAYARRERRSAAPAEPTAIWYDRAGRKLDRAGGAESPDRAAIAGTGLPGSAWPTSRSPDGRVVLFQTISDDVSSVWSAPADGSRPAARLFPEARDPAHAQFSPDGRWVAYSALVRDRRHVYVEPFPATGARVIVSSGGGEQPRWRADGREIVYLVEGRYVASVAVNTEGGFHADGPRRLFEARVPFSADRRFQMALAPDGQSLLINTVAGPDSIIPLDTIDGWRRALRLTRRDTVAE